MSTLPLSVERLVAEFSRLPGVGPKTAVRLAFHCLRASDDAVIRLSEALRDVASSVHACPQCFFITDTELCAICTNTRRNHNELCVVEESLDVLAIERSGEFTGVYHVLEGAVSPIDGVGPDKLRIAELVARVQQGGVTEVIIATDPDVEGETTAHVVADRLSGLPVSVTRLAYGLPAGLAVQYVDELTMARAFSGRRTFVAL